MVEALSSHGGVPREDSRSSGVVFKEAPLLLSAASYVKVVNTTPPRKGRKYDGSRRVYGGFT